jgi:hypothetical protein
MKNPAHIRQYRRLKHLRRVNRLLWTLGFVLAGVFLAYLFSGWMLGPRIRKHLEKQTGAAVFLESAHWIGPASIRLENLLIASDSKRPSETSIVQVHQADCSFSLLDLLRLRLEVRSVAVQEAVVQAQYDRGSGCWNFASLAFFGEPKEPSRVPVFFLNRATVRVEVAEDGRVQRLTNVGLQGRIVSEDRGRRYRFSLEAAPAGDFAGSRIDGVWKREKGRGRIWLDGRIQMPLIYIYGNAWNLDQIRLDCEYQKDRLEIDRFSCRMGEGTAELRGVLEGPAGEKNLDVWIRLDQMRLAGNSSPDAIVYSEPVLDMLDPGLQRFLRRFEPEGIADAQMQIQGQLSDLAKSRITGEILCRDIAIVDQKFPYRLEKMTGRIELSGKNLILHDLQARHGASSFVIGGEIENMGRNARIGLRVSSGKVELTEDIKQALPPRLQQTWFEFAPTGTCAIDYTFLRRPDGSRHQQLRADLLDVGCLYDRYPYPLSHLTGSILFDPNFIELDKIASRPGEGQEITVEGTIRRIRTPSPLCDLTIRTHGLPLDRTLRNTLRKPQRQMLEEFDAVGRLDLDMRVKGVYEESKAVPYQASFVLQADLLVWKRFPLPLQQVELRGSFAPGMLTIESLSAVAGQGQIRGSGQIHQSGSDPTRPGGAASFSAEDLVLDADFWKAMQTAGVYPEVFSKVRAEGMVDLDGQLLVNDPQTANTEKRLTIHFKKGSLVSAKGDWKSGPASGIIHLRDAQVALQDCAVLQVPVNDSFFALAAPAAEDLAALHPSAVLDLRIHQAQWDMASPVPSYEGDGQIEVRQGCLPSLAVDHLEGFVEGRLSRRGGQPAAEGRGRFEVRSFQVLGRSITDLAGPWNADPNSGLICPAITALCYEGTVRARAVFESARPQVPFKAEMEFETIHLEPFLKAGRTEESEPTTEADRHFAEGRLRGSIGLSGNLRQLDRVEGRVDLDARDLKIGRESLVGKALSMMRLRQADEYLFNEMLVEAYLDGLVVRGERIMFAGKNDVYQGRGTLNLKDHTIRMELSAFGRRRDQQATVLTALAENLGAALAKVEITGTLEQPVMKPVPLPIIPRPF